jgi:hypothetical protein
MKDTGTATHQPQEAWTARMGKREIRKESNGRLSFRPPSWVIQLHGFNHVGWFGWDPLNERWVSAPFGVAFGYGRSLREALNFIDWYKNLEATSVIDFIRAYRHTPTLQGLTQEQRKGMAELLSYTSYATRAIYRK